jgi:hypothetical protein
VREADNHRIALADAERRYRDAAECMGRHGIAIESDSFCEVK